MPRRAGGGRKKRRTHIDDSSRSGPTSSSPRCFVIERGDVGASVKALASDWRRLMAPNCASRLKGNRRNRLKDFVSASSVFKVTHLLLLTQPSTSGPILKLMKLPSGPTLTFRIKSFTLASDVAASHYLSSTRKQAAASAFHFETSPFIVLTGFKAKVENGEGSSESFPTSLLATFLGHMFPAIDVHTAAAKDCRRVLLFHHDKETHSITLRQYIVIKKPTGVSKGVRRLVGARNSAKKLLGLPEKKNVSQLVLDSGYASDSSANNEEEVPFVGGSGEVFKEESPKKLAIKLSEVGPRLTLELLKIEEGSIVKGKVLYHKYVSRSKEEGPNEEEEEKLRVKRQRELEKVLGEHEQNESSVTQDGNEPPLKKIKVKFSVSG